MITRSCRRYASGSASVFACLLALSSAVYAADTRPQVQVNIAGNLGTFQGTAAPKAKVFVYEGLDLNMLVAKVETDAEGNFSFAAKPFVNFFDERTGQLKSQAFVSYQILAFGLDDAGKPQMLHRFQSVRFQPGDVSNKETWSLKLKKMPAGSAAPKNPPGVLPQGGVMPFNLLQPRVHRVGVGGANPQGRVVLTGGESQDCPYVKYDLGSPPFSPYFPFPWKEIDLCNHQTKVGELHKTAGAATTFEFGISSAVTIDVGVSYDNGATFSAEAGYTHGEGLKSIWNLAETDPDGVEAIATFRYYRTFWHYDDCPFRPLPLFCTSYDWQTVRAGEFNGGGEKGARVIGDNIQPDDIPARWNVGPVDPGNEWEKSAGDSWYFSLAVGLDIEGVKAELGIRLEGSQDTKYHAAFDKDRKYDYTKMIPYDGGTNRAVWYFTHALEKETLAATNETSTSVRLQWTPFTGLDFAKYEIWYRKLGTNPWSLHSAITNKETTSGEFGSLAPGTTYQFQAKVKENSGLYSETNVVERKTDGGGGSGGGCGWRCRPIPM